MADQDTDRALVNFGYPDEVEDIPDESAHIVALDGGVPSEETGALAVQLPPALIAEFFAIARRMAIQNGLEPAEQVLSRALAELLVADRVHVRYYHPGVQKLWQIGESPHAPERDRGLAVQAARAGLTVWTDCARQVRLYETEADDPGGDGNERLLVQPLRSNGQVVAVVTVSRRAQRPEFSPEERAMTEAIAGTAAPILAHFVFRYYSEMQDKRLALSSGLFREEAEAHRQGVRDKNGAPIRIAPEWVKYCYWVILGVAGIGLIYLMVARVGQYSTGPAIIRVDGERLTARAEGTVSRVRVKTGQMVKVGDPLVEFYAGNEAVGLDEADKEYSRQLASFLLDPADNQAKTMLSAAATQLESARARVNQRTVRATREGRISDLRVRQGMLVGPGEHVVTIEKDKSKPKIVAFLPGSDLPQLKKGMKLRLELAGYNTPTIFATVEEIGQEVIGPREAARYLGMSKADAAPVGGAVVVVVASLPVETFEFEDQPYRFHDGMPGSAEVEINSESILYALVPGLRKLFK